MQNIDYHCTEKYGFDAGSIQSKEHKECSLVAIQMSVSVYDFIRSEKIFSSLIFTVSFCRIFPVGTPQK